MTSSIIQTTLLAFFLPLALYKIWRFSKKLHELASTPSSSSEFRQRLERIWGKNSDSAGSTYMKSTLLEGKGIKHLFSKDI